MGVRSVASVVDGRRTMVVGLVADSGLPTEMAEALALRLPEQLSRHVTDTMGWRVSVVSQILYLDILGQPTVLNDGKTMEDRGWDMMVALTELPLQQNARSLILAVDTSSRTSWVSLPALGGLRMQEKLLAAVLAVVHRMAHTMLAQSLRQRINSP